MIEKEGFTRLTAVSMEAIFPSSASLNNMMAGKTLVTEPILKIVSSVGGVFWEVFVVPKDWLQMISSISSFI